MLSEQRERVWKNSQASSNEGFITKLLIKERLAVPYTGQNKKEIAVAHEINRIALIEEGKL